MINASSILSVALSLEINRKILGIQFLVKISTDLGLPEREIYEAELKKVNKMKEIQLQVIASAWKISMHIK